MFHLSKTRGRVSLVAIVALTFSSMAGAVADDPDPTSNPSGSNQIDANPDLIEEQ